MNLKNKKAVLIKPDGSYESVEPKNKSSFTLERMQSMVEGYIQMLPCNEDGFILIVNEEAGLGKLFQENIRGSMYYKYGRTTMLKGNVLMTKQNYIK